MHRAEEYSLPRAVAEVVDFVAPAVHIPRISEAAHRSLEGTHGRAHRRLQHTQQKLNTPAVLRELYESYIESYIESRALRDLNGEPPSDPHDVPRRYNVGDAAGKSGW